MQSVINYSLIQNMVLLNSANTTLEYIMEIISQPKRVFSVTGITKGYCLRLLKWWQHLM